MKTRDLTLLGNMNVVVLLILVLLPWRAEATIWFDENLEAATVPMDPSKTALDADSVMAQGFQGAPPGWALDRRPWNNGNPFNGGANPDECYFTTERAHSGTKSLKVQYFAINAA